MARWQTSPVSVQIAHPVCVCAVDFVTVSLGHPERGWKQTVHHPITQPASTATCTISVPYPSLSAGRNEATAISAWPHPLGVIGPWLPVA